MATSVNEGSSSWITVTLTDRFGALAEPTAVSYRIDCLTSGAAILTKTDIAAPGSVFDLSILASQNAIQVSTNPQEYRRLTVVANYGSSDQLTAEFDYFVNNLRFIPIA